MSSTNQTNPAGSGAMTPEQYQKMLAAIEAAERDNAALKDQEKKLRDEINKLSDDEYAQDQWLKDHDHWYDKIAQFFSWDKEIHENEKANDEWSINDLTNKLHALEDKINNNLDKQFAVPIAMLDLQVKKLFKELLNSNGNVSQKLLEDVMAIMSEVMALVQVILAQSDNRKGEGHNQISEVTVSEYKKSNENTKVQLNEYISAMKTAAIMKIVNWVVKAVVCIAAILIAAATDGACAVFVALIITALVMSGATDKLTEVISKQLQKDGLSSGLGTVLSDVIVTAIMIVGTLGIGAVTAVLEGIVTEVISSIARSVVSKVVDSVSSSVSKEIAESVSSSISESISEAASQSGEDIVQSVTEAGESAAKTVLNRVGTSAGNAALRGAIRNILRQSLAGTIRQVMTSAGRNALESTVETSVKEAVEEAIASATSESTEAATTAMQGIIRGTARTVIERTVESIALQATENITTNATNAAARSLANVTSVNVTRSIVNGVGSGIMGTNLISDTLGEILQAIYGKDVKKKRWYKILMDVVQVIQDILALLVMAKFGGSPIENSGNKMSMASKLDKLQYAATGALGVAGVTQGILSFIQGGIEQQQATVTKSLASNKESILILNQLVHEMDQLIKDENRHQSSELKDETNNTLKTINALNQGAQSYANVLAATAV